MTITIETLATGDTNYISKHNANYVTIKAAIDALQLTLTGSSSSVINFPAFALTMLGAVVGKLATADVIATDGGSAILDIAAGTVWIPSATQVRTGGAISLDFTGQSTDTYYTHMDAVGAWSFDTTAADAVHTIAFTSPSTFTTITESAVVVWGDAINQNAKTSTVLGGTTYGELGELTEAIAGATASRHPVTMTASDVTLTTQEAFEHSYIEITGALTGDRDLILPDFENTIIVLNNTTGAFDVGVRTSAQPAVTFPIVAQGAAAVFICDGTNVLGATIEGTSTISSTPYVIGSRKNGLPGTIERVFAHSFPSGMGTFTLAASAVNSSVEAETSATAQTDFDCTKNDVSIGTIRFAIAGTVATFVGFGGDTFVGGDRIEIIAPASQDATLAEVYFTMFLTRL